ncbi:hypothetical protein [Actinomadura macrotermitis]|uniref:Lipoprotein n=1 Tax=Actinomadura macrotermitis TaxID=2585200 RepID=A0A7K0C4Z7_9ACTN|nr:hypothetical protein [Actinomadura macrotermitis]MQY08513.1 hypothetical protein [Actinomadura macrotermitis]
MLLRILCALALVPPAAGCTAEAVKPRDPVQAAGRALGPALPAVRPYEFNAPQRLTGWARDPKLERSADFTKLASALPQPLRDRLTGIKAGYYRMPGSDRVMDRFFYAGGTLRGGGADAVIEDVKKFAADHRRRTVTAATVPFGSPDVKSVQVGFGLGAYQNAFAGGPVTTNDSVVWTDGRTVGLITMEVPATSAMLARAKRVHAELS